MYFRWRLCWTSLFFGAELCSWRYWNMYKCCINFLSNALRIVWAVLYKMLGWNLVVTLISGIECAFVSPKRKIIMIKIYICNISTSKLGHIFRSVISLQYYIYIILLSIYLVCLFCFVVAPYISSIVGGIRKFLEFFKSP